MFPHRNFHKYTFTSPDGQTQNQIDNIFIDRRWHSSILDVRSFRGTGCDTVYYLVVARVRERLTVGNQAAQKSNGEIFIIWKLNSLNRFAALENVSNGEDINTDLENIKENVETAAKNRLGLCELKQHKPWFQEECSSFLDQRKQAKFQSLQDPNQSNEYNLNNVRREATSSGQLRKKKEYLKAKIDEL
jgi:hypothetical protein